MFVYSAGSLDVPRMERMANESGQNNLLFTFAHKDAQECARHFCKQPHRNIIVDSGAFSTWNKDLSVSLEEYIAFCCELKEIAQCPIAFMSLDKIAGSRAEGRLPTEKQTEEACETSWKYYRQLRAAGIEAIPTFHQFEDPKWLFQFLNDGIDYIALSPRKSGVSTADKVEWLGHVFKEVGIDTKVHGLGVAGSEAMESFPFYSIDSSSWLQGSNGTFRYFDGRRVRSLSRDDWQQDSIQAQWDDGTDAVAEARKEYRPPGPGGNYHFMMRALEADARLQGFLTRLWSQRGVHCDSVPASAVGIDHVEQSNNLYREFYHARSVRRVAESQGMALDYVDWAIRVGRETAYWQAYQRGELPLESLADQLAWHEWNQQLSLREIYLPRQRG